MVGQGQGGQLASKEYSLLQYKFRCLPCRRSVVRIAAHTLAHMHLYVSYYSTPFPVDQQRQRQQPDFTCSPTLSDTPANFNIDVNLANKYSDCAAHRCRRPCAQTVCSSRRSVARARAQEVILRRLHFTFDGNGDGEARMCYLRTCERADTASAGASLVRAT